MMEAKPAKIKKFKKKWIYKAFTWKIISILLGGGVVHWLTGEFKMATDYLLVYTPLSLLLYFLHEAGWQWAKNRKRLKQGIAVVEIDVEVEYDEENE